MARLVVEGSGEDRAAGGGSTARDVSQSDQGRRWACALTSCDYWVRLMHLIFACPTRGT